MRWVHGGRGRRDATVPTPYISMNDNDTTTATPTPYHNIHVQYTTEYTGGPRLHCALHAVCTVRGIGY